MPDIDSAGERRRRILSAIADGEAAPDEATAAVQAWRDDADARATWHAYQLIGDVMRSDDLARPASRDSALLQAVRARLADEPVVLAPAAETAAAPAAGPRERGVEGLRANRGAGARAWVRGHWQAPAAMAAGFLVVAGGLSALGPRTGGAGPALAGAGPAAASATVLAGIGAASSATAGQASARLAPYLAAHRQLTTMNAAFQMPDASVRTVSLEQAPR